MRARELEDASVRASMHLKVSLALSGLVLARSWPLEVHFQRSFYLDWSKIREDYESLVSDGDWYGFEQENP